jgi:allophanate hydrolase subunit 2
MPRRRRDAAGVAGPQRDSFSADALARLTSARFTVSPESNRMGYRLTGATVPVPGDEMISDVTFPGALQVPPSGEPILLMADRQTTGGYAQLAIVISADLPVAGQLAPGDWVEFELTTHSEAISALQEQERALQHLEGHAFA